MDTTPHRAWSRNRPEAGTVPFISDWRDLTPFADLPANAGVTNATHMLGDFVGAHRSYLERIDWQPRTR